MSRVGKKPIPIPDKVKISYENGALDVQGEKGRLSRTVHPLIDLVIEDGAVKVVPKNEDRKTIALQGLTRSLVANMVTGVGEGFSRTLEINGIGYRAEVSGANIVLNLGYSQPVTFDIPDGVTAVVEKNTVIKLSSIDKELLGHTAAAIRGLRPPEPYKGKGVKFADEYIQRKAGKSGKK